MHSNFLAHIQALDAKGKEAAAFQDESLACENRWGVCTRKAVSAAYRTRIFTQWRDVALIKKVNMQIIHTAFASTSTRWFRRSLKQRFLGWKSAAVQTVSIADTISVSSKSRSVRSCFDDWLMCARNTAREAEHAAVESNAKMVCDQMHEKAMVALKEEMTAQTTTLVLDQQHECNALLQHKEAEASDQVSKLEASHAHQIMMLEQTLETQTRELAKAVADLKEEHAQRVVANTQAHEEEMIQLNHLLEAKRFEMDSEVCANLTADNLYR